MEDSDIVRQYYDQNARTEWERLCLGGRMRPEFVLSARMLEGYIRPGDRVLDLGGGPGRYSLHLAQMGARVTLADLSPANVALALELARERGLPLRALTVNALDLSPLAGQVFDHVLCMGPLYHLLEAGQQRQCVANCLAALRPGGTLFASFIGGFAGVIYALKEQPEWVTMEALAEVEYKAAVVAGRGYGGDAFTRACFVWPHEIEALMAGFPLEKLHLMGCEGILAPNEVLILEQPEAVYAAWLQLAWQLAERPELLSYSEHLMYVGRKA